MIERRTVTETELWHAHNRFRVQWGIESITFDQWKKGLPMTRPDPDTGPSRRSALYLGLGAAIVCAVAVLGVLVMAYLLADRYGWL